MRQTKIICTLGPNNYSVQQINNMMEGGMDVARINMDFFDISQMETLTKNIQESIEQLSVPCPIFIDLKGMLIRTLPTNNRIELKVGQRICLTDDADLVGIYDDLVVIDCPQFSGKLREGDKVVINYGSIELTVTGFEDKETYK